MKIEIRHYQTGVYHKESGIKPFIADISAQAIFRVYPSAHSFQSREDGLTGVGHVFEADGFGVEHGLGNDWFKDMLEPVIVRSENPVKVQRAHAQEKTTNSNCSYYQDTRWKNSGLFGGYIHTEVLSSEAGKSVMGLAIASIATP